MENISRSLGLDFEKIKPHLPWATLLLLVVIVGVADSNFLKPANLVSMAADIVPLFIMAMGITFAIYIGGIDLSAQSVANMTTVEAAMHWLTPVVTSHDLPWSSLAGPSSPATARCAQWSAF